MGVRLNLGCGLHVKKGFFNVDKCYTEEDLKNHTGICKNSIWERGAIYYQADIKKLPFEDDFADYVEAFEVLEHLPFREVIPVLKEIHRVMKPGAKLLIHTPNFDGLMKDWIDLITTDFNIDSYINVMETIYGNQLADGEYHQCAFNPGLMNYFLTLAGFKKGTLAVVPKGHPVPVLGSDKPKKGSVMRNELLIAEVTK